MSQPLNLHIYQSSFRNESRILKQTKSMCDHGVVGRILIAAIWDEGLPEEEAIDAARSVWRVKIASGSWRKTVLTRLVKYSEFMWRVWCRVRREKVEMINCHSLSVLPLGVAMKLRCGARLIYDAHELETEIQSMRGPVKHVAKLLERFLIRFVDHTIVVNKSIADWYRDAYGRSNVSYVQNVPRNTGSIPPKSRVLRDAFSIPDSDIIYTCQGALNPYRSVEYLLEVFSKVPPQHHIVFMGRGTFEERIKEFAGRFSNIHFQPAVPVEQVERYAASADVGFSLNEDTCLNHYYSLPNRVFDCLLSGLAIAVSDFPEQAAIVDRFDCGWKVHPTLGPLLELVPKISREEVDRKKANALEARAHFGWHLEEARLLEVYGKPTKDVAAQKAA